MKSFSLNGYSGRQERWALDGHRWVAAEPRRNGFNLWGYQDDTSEIVYLGSGANEEQLEKLADEFLLGDPEIMNPAFFLKDDYPMIHAKDDGNTLLHFASRAGNILLIRKLLQQGEDINAKNRAGQTALDIAQQYQQSEVVLELSRHGTQR